MKHIASNALKSVKHVFGETAVPLTILDKAVILLRRSEEALDTGRRFDISLLRPVTRVISAFGLLQGGAFIFIRPVLLFLLYWIIAQFVIGGLTKVGTGSQADATGIQYVAFLFAAILAAFELPSQYVSDRVPSKAVHRAKSEFIAQCTINVDEAKHILDILKELYDRANSRVKAAQWIITFAWAVALFIWGQYSGIALKNISSNEIGQVLSDSLPSALALLFITIMCGFAALGYKRAVERVFLTARTVVRELSIAMVTQTRGQEG
ncbi:hypothetical protein [Cupriavidus sp. L7L]|uniref:hypothetical protein n=1 Tax=Cupriavidus sp. L7L TaxID=2546443 RepID=UPI0010567932|nr:hypothetical protein [Cupriavidus sp. L7L]TDF63298.1 hypothetical protein E1J61_24975 [Cupriavidus sp. L7L]